MRKEKLTIAKVLYARPSIGGSGRVGLEVALELARRGHDMHIISYPGTYLAEEEAKLLKIHNVADVGYGSFKVPPSGLTFPSTIRNLAEESNIDVLHAHYAITHGEAVIDGREIIKRDMRRGKLPHQKKLPVAVITCHGTDISVNGYKDAIAPGLELRLSQADGLTFVASALQEEAKRLFELENYGTVIPNFIDERKFRRDPSGETSRKIRAELGIPNESVVFYHVSNFRPVKNIEIAIGAMNLAVNKYGLKDAYLVLIGDGPDKPKAESKVKEYGLGNRVIFKGAVDPERVPEYGQAGNVLILPSKKESFGLVNLEAMHLENPILSSNTGGIPEVVIDGENGFLCEPDDIKAFAHYMAELANKPELRRKMGQAGREIAETKFGRKKICDMYEDFYHRVLEKNEALNATQSRI